MESPSQVKIDPKELIANISCFPGGVATVEGAYLPQKTWGELFSKHALQPMKQAANTYVAGVLKEGGRRCNSDISVNTIIVLDYDLLTLTELGQLKLRIRRFAYIMYTTHRHLLDPERCRVRIIFLLTIPIEPNKYAFLHDLVSSSIERVMGIRVDPSCRTSSQAHYFPSCPPERAKDAFIDFNEGLPIDVETAFSRCRVIKPRRSDLPEGLMAWDLRALPNILSKCIFYAELFRRIEVGHNLNHRERLRVAQLTNALNAPLDFSSKLFVQQKNYCREKTIRQLKSIKGCAPSCKSIAREFRICDGACPQIKAANGGSPIQFYTKPNKGG